MMRTGKSVRWMIWQNAEGNHSKNARLLLFLIALCITLLDFVLKIGPG